MKFTTRKKCRSRRRNNKSERRAAYNEGEIQKRRRSFRHMKMESRMPAEGSQQASQHILSQQSNTADLPSSGTSEQSSRVSNLSTSPPSRIANNCNESQHTIPPNKSGHRVSTLCASDCAAARFITNAEMSSEENTQRNNFSHLHGSRHENIKSTGRTAGYERENDKRRRNCPNVKLNTAEACQTGNGYLHPKNDSQRIYS